MAVPQLLSAKSDVSFSCYGPFLGPVPRGAKSCLAPQPFGVQRKVWYQNDP